MKKLLIEAVPFVKTSSVFIFFIFLSQIFYNLSTNYFDLSNGLDVSKPIYIVFSILYCLYVIIYSMIVCRYVDKRSLTDFGFKISLKDIFLSIISLCIIFFGFLIFSIVLKENNVAIWKWTNVPIKYVLSATIIYLTVGINEEIFLRIFI